MAVTTFIPELWSARLIDALENSHVATAICNRDYEGEITRAGNVVYINKVLDVAVGDYEGEVEYDEITTASIPLTIDQQKYYGFGVEDIDKAQAAGDFVDEAMKKAAYNLADAADKYIFDTIFNNENVIDINNGSPAPNIYMETVYTQVVKMRMQLDKKVCRPKVANWSFPLKSMLCCCCATSLSNSTMLSQVAQLLTAMSVALQVSMCTRL